MCPNTNYPDGRMTSMFRLEGSVKKTNWLTVDHNRNASSVPGDQVPLCSIIYQTEANLLVHQIQNAGA